jgi:DNA (cytosine-5)-methyltransferase 1
VRFHVGDIRRLTLSHAVDLIGDAPVDIVVGGPPCQGFSTLGDQLQGDPRNTLFEAFARVIRWTRPGCVLIENTSYLRSQYAGRYEREIRAILASLGYQVHVKTLNAVDFGTPQVRKRVFFFATRLVGDFNWPVPTHGPPGGALLPYRTVGEAMMDLADIGVTADVPNHIALRHSEKVLQRYRLIPEGGRLPPPQLLPPDIRRRNFGNTYKRLHRDRPSLTLVPGNNAFPVHPTEDRSLTPREGARLQGFPDDYVFAGTRAEQCQQVGNAVPVPLARRLAEAIADHIRSEHEAREEALQSPGAVEAPPVQLALPLNGSNRIGPRTGARRLTAVSFFTGAGGLMLGFERAGFDILTSYDRKNIVAQNLAINFPSVPHYKRDLEAMTLDEVQSNLGLAAIDVVFGGPPCEGFSIFGKRRFVNTKGHRPEDDPRNELPLKFVEIAVGLQPKVILMENVKGLMSTPRGDTTYIAEILGRLERGGYVAQHAVINCADYGIPQLRERLILIATLPDIAFDWPRPKYFRDPKPWQRPWTTVGDVIADLEDPSTHDPEFSHVPMNHGDLLVERYQLIPEGGRLPEADLPDHLRRGYRSDNIKNFSHVYRRLARNMPATTMVPGHNAFPIHPTLPRALTVREAARIQTFPDSMRFVGTRQQQCMLVGNAVPPVLAELFAQAIAKAIRGNARLPGYKADHYELKVRHDYPQHAGVRDR